MDELRDRSKQQPGPDKLFRSHYAAAGESRRTEERKHNRLNIAHKREAIKSEDVEQQIRTFFP